MRPTISVVICAYSLDRWTDLLLSVASTQEQSALPLETIVVVDHNEALFERAVGRFATGKVLAVESTQAPGLSGARNTGTALSRGEVVAFLDDDAVADADWLERLGAVYASEDVLGVGGEVEAKWVAGRPRTFPPEFDWVVGCTYRGHPTTRRPIRNVIGANMSFRRSVLDESGGFRIDIGRVGTRPVGCEETELALRVTAEKPGGIILYEPAARVVHTVPPARGTWGYFARRCYGEGVSKAVVARIAGTAEGLSSERTYVVRALSHGIARNVAAGLSGDLAAFGRALRIVVGFSAAVLGYFRGSLAGFGRRP